MFNNGNYDWLAPVFVVAVMGLSVFGYNYVNENKLYNKIEQSNNEVQHNNIKVPKTTKM